MFLLPNDAKIIKVASSPLSAKRFFKGEDNTGHTVPVPDGPKDAVSKSAENNSSTHTHAYMSRHIHIARRQLFMTCLPIFSMVYSRLKALCVGQCLTTRVSTMKYMQMYIFFIVYRLIFLTIIFKIRQLIIYYLNCADFTVYVLLFVLQSICI